MAITQIQVEENLKKLDELAVDGLLGTADSLAYKVNEVEKHFHNHEDWFGAAGTPSGETHVADDITDGTLAAFQIDAGNDDWGAWVQILGSSDTPNRTSMAYFDIDRIQIVDSEAAAQECFIQFGFGATGAAALAAGTYTTLPYLTATNQSAEGSTDMKQARCVAGEKAWARTMAIGANTHTLDFYFGIHEYVG